jgi:hypothetical protein
MTSLGRQDGAVLLAGLAAVGGATVWAQLGGLASSDIGFASVLPKVTVVVALLGAVFAYMARDFYGGGFNRGLEVVASGFLIYGIIWWPHKVGWHGGGTPAWLGVIEPAWQTFFHLLTAITLGIVSYGFFLLWKEGKR